MARIAVTTYRFIDDLTQREVSKAEELETVTLSIDGRVVELDLTTENARHLRKQLNPFMRAGRQANLSRYKTTLKSGRPAWADKPELLGEDPKPAPKPEAPKVEAPKPPAVPPVDPPKPAPVATPATAPGGRSLGEIAAASSLTNGAAAILGTGSVPAARVPDSSEVDDKEPGESGEPIDWAEWAPSPRDNTRRAGAKVRAWCTKKGLTVHPRVIGPKIHKAYKDFYADTSNWAAVPPREDLLTNTSKALADAAQRVR